jgi:hypothetical protein
VSKEHKLAPIPSRIIDEKRLKNFDNLIIPRFSYDNNKECTVTKLQLSLR